MLPRPFFARDAETVARSLLGTTLCVASGSTTARVRVVETEAYVGPHDAACHARAGLTARTRVMFGPAGHAYVYLVYGLHDMLNVVTGAEGEGEAVLVRAAEPVAGVLGRTDGPARLCKALGLTVADHNGLDLCARRGLWFEAGLPPAAVAVGPRVGVGYAGDWADAPLRFWDTHSRHVSRAPGTPRPGRPPAPSRA